jgi:hypothetical protein
MKIPEFTAEATVYKTSYYYGSSCLEGDLPRSTGRIALAYHPMPETNARCDARIAECLDNASNLGDRLEARCETGCVFYGPLFYACYAPCHEWVEDIKSSVFDSCYSETIGPGPQTKCCPVACEGWDPGNDPGVGCCDSGENCVDQADPNSREGCCPSDQIVCGGKCCAKTERYCIDGNFCSQYASNIPFGNASPPPPPANNCLLGGTPCGKKCCPPGLQCCGVFEGQPDCKSSCVR